MKYIINPSDVFYLTGIQVTERGETVVVMSGKKTYLLTNVLVSEQLKKSHPDCKIIDTRETKEEFLKSINNLETDPEYLTVFEMQQLKKKIKGKLTFEKEQITKKRQIKTEKELKILKESQKLNEQVLENILTQIEAGMSEVDLEKIILIEQLKLGTDGPSFHPIVAFGEGGANPHHINRRKRKLKKGDQILIDMGVIHKGYCSDMTRVIFTDDPTELQYEIWELLADTVARTIKQGKVGMSLKTLHNFAAKSLGEYSKYFNHTLGHGLGIDIHETPRVGPKSNEKIREGMVFTIEPGIYIPGKLGSRYEDVVIARKNGLENITKAPAWIQIEL